MKIREYRIDYMRDYGIRKFDVMCFSKETAWYMFSQYMASQGLKWEDIDDVTISKIN